VTLPKALLASAGLGPGDALLVQVVADGVLRLVREDDPMTALIGSMPGLSAAASLEAMRDEWAR
jgi:antitoxin component of MazEF toxin-antitoxin module